MAASPDYQALFALSPNPYCLLDRQLRYVTANAAYLQVTASRLEDLVGRGLFDAFPHDPADPNNAPALQLRASLEKVLATRERDVLALIRYRVPRLEGGHPVVEDRYWSATHTPVLDAHGEVAFILQHTTDVTELQRLKEASAAPLQVEAGVLQRAHQVQLANHLLDAERRHLRALFEQAPGFVGVLRGPTHVFELANAAYLQLVGGRPLVGKPVHEALPEVAEQGFLELLDRVLATGEPYVGRDVPVHLLRHAGEPAEQRFVDFVYQPIFDAQGRASGIFVLGHDVTEKKRLELARAELLEREQAARREAEEANRLKDDFLATVSHELRTPLTAILGWVQILCTQGFPEERRRRALETVERNARAQAQLIDDLLDISRVLAGNLRLEPRPVALGAVVEAALESVRPAAEARGLQLEAAIEPHAQVLGDAARLQQVVWNLVSNAVKFTPPGGRVQVRVAPRDGALELRVADTGQGIPQDFLPHVFERFRQADGSPTRQHGGLGLGLAIAKHLVELHGGSIGAESPGDGQGATFRVTLPLAAERLAALSAVPPTPAQVPAPAAQRASTPAQPFTCPAQMDGLRVLVVDDEADVREMLRVVLESCGAQVHAAGSVEEAFALFRRTRPDILLSDVGMPGEDGYALVRRIRALGAADGGRTPAVALTAYARAEDRTRALLAGFHAHVPKPVEPAELVAALSALAPERA
ncbi:response regulator [Aggregicoccus sp. 17bor-14]|uniref:hybrid sensor histidine kinase/response regulator n=1 Tax=Myxococcaceae TaxID=31 RepID=UPI00129CDFB8|nr:MULTISPECIES: PAS domain-containing sensor histidine kinase [Myxococcaceae]MBF5042272.1 PAS domain-containing protein [Simulacricoccus sp. 17bor-14]MRI88046.1 response regulator [Aggregicoccus sp. 17bor-14]